MRIFAHYPHDNKTWLSYGHTVPDGNPPLPFWNSNCLDTMLFLPTVLKTDSEGIKKVKILEDDVFFLWLVPISSNERELKLQKGLDALLSIFDKHKHSHVYNPKRNSYV